MSKDLNLHQDKFRLYSNLQAQNIKLLKDHYKGDSSR